MPQKCLEISLRMYILFPNRFRGTPNLFTCTFFKRSPSKLVEGLKNSYGDGLIGAYSPGIPGKHTLQRPFLSSRPSISFNTIFEDAENCATAVDDDDDAGEIKRENQEGETSVEEADIEGGESRTAHASESLSSQSAHPLTGIQKLFMETEEEETNKVLQCFFSNFLIALLIDNFATPGPGRMGGMGLVICYNIESFCFAKLDLSHRLCSQLFFFSFHS